ncbi:hypothetical protein GWK47_017624 [Chionoecetes opilio]|uniref:Uncharacterized protein n=1 Tax=Chionoecetes opilio TaxID=41210 RepID=A0A8J4XRQ9_CHIOP|nr:hypothetical protein GWK47_017624 [Chionoecetes opilio]
MEEPRLASKKSFEDHLVELHDGEGQPKQASSEVLCQSECKHLAPCQCSEAWCPNKKGLIDLVPDGPPLRPPPSRHCSHVSASESELAGPKEGNSASIFPCEEDGDAVLRIAREGRRREERGFQSQWQRTNHQVSPGSRRSFHDSSRRPCSSPHIRARWTCSSRPPYSQCPFQELER